MTSLMLLLFLLLLLLQLFHWFFTFIFLYQAGGEINKQAGSERTNDGGTAWASVDEVGSRAHVKRRRNRYMNAGDWHMRWIEQGGRRVE